MEATSKLITGLIHSLKRYLGLQKKYIQLDLTEKLTLLLTTLVLGLIFFVLGAFVIVFLALALSAVLAKVLGSVVMAHLVVAGLFVFTGALLYLMRRKWIIDPLTQIFAGILLDNINDTQDDDEEY